MTTPEGSSREGEGLSSHEFAGRVSGRPARRKSGLGARAGMNISFGQTPEDVARATLRALGRRATTCPGVLPKALEASLSPLPRFARTRVMAMVMSGMTAA